MHFGVSMFHTDYSIPAVELARHSKSAASNPWAPEHSRIPVRVVTTLLPEPHDESAG